MLSTLLSLVAAAGTFTPAPAHQLLTEDGARVRVETGTLSAPLAGDLPQAVRAWALSQRERYGLAPAATLETKDVFSTRFGASFHLLETVKGVEVYGAKLVVTLDEQRRVTLVTSSLENVTRVVDGAALTTDEVLRRAADGLTLPALRPDGVPYGGAKRFYFRVGDELHGGWLANVKTLDLSKNWYVALDGVTGETLFVQDRVHRARLDAQVYPVSPGGLDAGVGATPTVLRSLAHADGGAMVGDECAVPLLDGGIGTYPNDGGELCGTQLMMYNCCPSEGCAPDAGPRRVAGSTSFGGFAVQYDVAVCDRVRRASSVTNGTGDYVYAPVDPPANKMAVETSDPANSDEFAEVHSFYHVNTVYDWVRRLSTKAGGLYGGTPAIAAFTMRDERPSHRTPTQKVAVWSNVMFPNFNELLGGGFNCLLQPPCRANTLLRLDNAAFFPRENFSQLPLPGFDTGVDTLMIFQGNAADAAYDATVIQHEFGHGVVYSTANISFDSIAIDTRSANNEGGALHEGFADYIAAAFNNLADVGPYFGPRALASAGVPGVMQNSYLRSMDNTFSCPDVLWGEVHQDSQHLAAALWEARKLHFLGSDQGDTYDAAFYAMLVGITPDADFAMTAMVMADRVKRAFPAITDAETKMNAIFARRGVVGCSKVLDFPAGSRPRPYYGVAAASGAFMNSVIPGPFQFKIPAAMGASKVTLAATVAGNGNPLGGNGPPPQVLVKGGSPITFTRMGANLVNNADVSGVAPNGAGMVTVNVPCGQDVYVSLAAQGGGVNLQNVNVTITPLASCTPAMDAGMGGGGGSDGGAGGGTGGGGTDTTTIPSVGQGNNATNNAAKVGCGCSTPVDGGGFALLALLALRRRQRR
ncbi:MAG: MYXO-CTERM sorting domain-containing protein [Myxococcota bacterium]|jgi:MYXO-CTERM domain-containing protein